MTDFDLMIDTLETLADQYVVRTTRAQAMHLRTAAATLRRDHLLRARIIALTQEMRRRPKPNTAVQLADVEWEQRLSQILRLVDDDE